MPSQNGIGIEPPGRHVGMYQQWRSNAIQMEDRIALLPTLGVLIAPQRAPTIHSVSIIA